MSFTLYMRSVLRPLSRLPRPLRMPRPASLAARPGRAAGASATASSGPGQLAHALRKQVVTSPFNTCDKTWAGEGGKLL